MKNINAFVFFFALLLTSGKAQQNNVWPLPPNSVEFLPAFQILNLLHGSGSLAYTGTQSEYGHNAMQDRNGELLFFIVDGVIYDKDGEFMNMLLTSGSTVVKGNSEVCIVPDPANCRKYYIFTSNPVRVTDSKVWTEI